MRKLRMGVLGCSYHYFKRVAVPLRDSFLIEPYAIASRDAVKAASSAKEWGFLFPTVPMRNFWPIKR
ncbi:hypothetical protein MASR2M78_22580 [Treponema sp.]